MAFPFLSLRTLAVSAVPAVFLLGGCASFPKAGSSVRFEDGLAAPAIFERCLKAHGGDVREWAQDLNFSVDGTWDFLVQRIQPLVADGSFRERSQERIRPSEQLYSVLWTGPKGTKKVVRTPETVEVYLNDIRASDPATREASAMTADATQLFHLGPSFLAMRRAEFVRLEDGREDGVTYRRLLTTLRPGLGFSPRDDVVLWIHPDNDRLFRVHLTVDGFKGTRGAHVDTTFLAYRQVGRMLVPVEMNERLRAPFPLNVHRWRMTGVDFNRGWDSSAVTGATLERGAREPAKAID